MAPFRRKDVPASIDALGCVRGRISVIRRAGILAAPRINYHSGFTGMRGGGLSKLRKSGTVTVIFASALPSFEKQKIRPRNYEGKELELTGEIKDHPKYGVEMILEEPSQIKVLD